MFQRCIDLVGIDNFNKIKNTYVLVVGLGGVGGTTVEALIRSGISNIIIMDYDIIEDSNLNRQIITNRNNIGMKKVIECEKRIKSINSECNVIALNMFLDKDNISILDDYRIDYIIDCCDTINAKKLLIDYSIDKNIKLISSMGTANKLDPSKLEICDIRKTSYDPLAKIIRKYVLDKKTNKKIMVVSSIESPVRKDSLASMMIVPSTAGLLLASYVINDIIKEKDLIH